jgi:hypothetical protein
VRTSAHKPRPVDFESCWITDRVVSEVAEFTDNRVARPNHYALKQKSR